MEGQSRNNNNKNNKGVPPAGILYLTKLRGKEFNVDFHKGLILLITFVTYTLFHASRKAPSIVKSVWDPPQQSTTVATNGTAHFSLVPSRKDMRVVFIINTGFVSLPTSPNPNSSFAERALPSSGILSNLAGSEFRDFSSNTDLSKVQRDLDFNGSSSSRNVQASFLLEANSNNDTSQVQGHEMLAPPPLPPSTPSGWAPFTGSRGKDKLGEVDFAFLVFYAFGMFFAGHLGDRIDLRWFLSVGMVGSGAFVCLIGMAYWWDIHILAFYIIVQMAAGLFQATGWPSVVTVVGNWFGKSKRGLIMGIWNAHTSTGNILGSLIAAGVLQYGWGWSFVVPGLLLVLGGVGVFFFLVVEPAVVGFESPYETTTQDTEGRNAEDAPDTNYEETVLLSNMESGGTLSDPEHSAMLANGEGHDGIQESRQLIRLKTERSKTLGRNDPAIGFLEAWQIPGVATYALCLFFSKLVAYTFLYWLPFYISQTRIAGNHLSDKIAGDLSTLFDVGGVLGGILAGYTSDCLSARAITSASFMLCAIPALYLYCTYGGISLPVNIGLMMLLGMFINGPYSLITTAVSADLGTHSSLKGSGKALATVTAIIDGTGSIGAALGPLLAGFISENFSWGAVFTMLMLAAFLSGLLLTKLVIGEVSEKLEEFQRVQVIDQAGHVDLAEL